MYSIRRVLYVIDFLTQYTIYDTIKTIWGDVLNIVQHYIYNVTLRRLKSRL